jgi:organic hydroperoxide reductase OsmC/OhrA
MSEVPPIARRHRYQMKLTWAGVRRDYLLTAGAKPAIACSSDAVFGGDPARWNPEDMLVASLSACHQLWYLGLAARAGLAVLAYEDDAEGVMVEIVAGSTGQFETVTLRPCVTLPQDADQKLALALHETAHKNCFIARSVNFPVTIEPSVKVTALDQLP